jgi:membrane protease YdiL (CAAX protease family)
MRTFLKGHSLLVYFILAFAGFWGCIALGYLSLFHFWVPILGALSPAVAALAVTGLSEGEQGVRQLVRRLGLWRVSPAWYLVALGLPLAQSLLSLGAAALLGKFKGINGAALGPILPAIWVVFIFSTGEELGWRGFALPRLLRTHKAIYASLILGAIHEIWHWPLILLPRQYLSDVPVLAHATFVLAEAIVITWIFLGTRGSVLLIAVYHGMTNAAGVLDAGIDPAWLPRIRPVVSVLVALIIVLATRGDLVRGSGSGETV